MKKVNAKKTIKITTPSILVHFHHELEARFVLCINCIEYREELYLSTAKFLPLALCPLPHAKNEQAHSNIFVLPFGEGPNRRTNLKTHRRLLLWH